MSCKGLCQQFKKSKNENGGIYLQGIKRCTNCNVNMMLDDLRCPCCNSLLTTHLKTLQYIRNDTMLTNAK